MKVQLIHARRAHSLLISLLCTAAVGALGETNATEVEEAWRRSYRDAAAGSMRSWDLAVDGVGNVYVTGTDEITPRGLTTVKYGPDGTERWVAVYEGANATAIVVDDTGNVFVTGYSIDADDKTHYVTVKYDRDGVQLWAATMDGGNTAGLALDHSGGVVVVGGAGTVRYDAEGNVVWSSSEVGSSVAVEANGSVFVSGQSLVKYDETGSELWRVDLDGFFFSFAPMALDAAGNVYLAGMGGPLVKYDGDGVESWRRDPGNLRGLAVTRDGSAYTICVSSSAAIIRFDPDGQRAWSADVEFSPANWGFYWPDITTDLAGNISATGITCLPGDDPGFLSECSCNGVEAVYGALLTVKYDAEGNQVWSVVQESQNVDRVISLASDASGNTYVAASTGCWSDRNQAYLTIKYSDDAGPAFLRSDCNGDGSVDISDAVFTLGTLFLGEEAPGCDDACDSNDDGALDVSDAINTLGVLFLGQGVLPHPVSSCGVDPTTDELSCGQSEPCN